MRTRIALVAIVPIACITVSLLSLAVLAQPARASTRTTHKTSARGHRAPDRLTADIHRSVAPVTPGLPNGLSRPVAAILAERSAVARADRPAPAVVLAVQDTVTPTQRAAWERVAWCEEGGDWQADGGRFSGGLGITRTNWVEFGGLRYASEGAEATPDEQIMVAERIQSYPPDQDGCEGW